MTTLNNFNHSSTGVDVKSTIFLDSIYGGILFREELERLDNSPYNDCSTYLHGKGLNPDLDDFDLGDPCNYKVNSAKEMYKAIIKEQGLMLYSEIKELFHLTGGLRNSLADIVDSYQLYYSVPAFEFLKENFESRYKEIEVIGYCQGDIAKVIIPDTLGYIDLDSLSKYLQKVIYDTPFYCEILINGTDLSVEDDVKSIYDYDKEEIIAIVKASNDFKELSDQHKAIVDQFLNDNLPDYL